MNITTEQFIMRSCHIHFLMCLGIYERPHRLGEVSGTGLLSIEVPLLSTLVQHVPGVTEFHGPHR